MMRRAMYAVAAGTLLVGCTPRTAVVESGAAPAPGVAAAFPTTAPTPGPAASLRLPAAVRRALPNGMEVVYVRHGSLPVVHATLVTRGGTGDEPPELTGLAGFTAAMLDEGAAGRGSLELADALAQLGASLGSRAGADAAFVDLYVLRPRLPEALRLMADVAARPDFPAAEIERLREERLTELRRAADEPTAIAASAFASLVYGPAHPYGRLATTQSVARVDRAALQRFHATFYTPAASTLFLVGDVDADELHPVVEQAFGGWRGEERPAATPPAAPELGRTTLYLVDKPGAAQSEIRIGHPGVSRASPDYFPLVVLNTLLGGSFTSRLNTNLREVHGFSYGAGSSFSMRRGPGPFTASSAVFTAKTDSAVVEFLREMRRIRDEPVPADELERAKRYVALGLPRGFETTSDVAGQLAELEVHGLSADLFNDYVARIMDVGAADVQRVARQHLRPDRAVIVVVGDRATIEPGLRALNLGPIEIREVAEFVR